MCNLCIMCENMKGMEEIRITEFSSKKLILWCLSAEEENQLELYSALIYETEDGDRVHEGKAVP